MPLPTVKLGKLAPRTDGRTLRLSRYLPKRALPPLPSKCDYVSPVKKPWGMLANDRVGNCAQVACLHQVMSMAAADGNPHRNFTDADAVKAYSDITGYDPRKPGTDNGSVMLDVMNYWRRKGFFGHNVAAFVSVNPKDIDEVKAACWLFGGLQVGLRLPLYAQDQLAKKEPWFAPINPEHLTGRYAPDTWGGHAVHLAGWEGDWFDFVTWGDIQKASKYFLIDYMDECYAVVSKDFFGEDSKAPNGFDLWQLWKDLEGVTDGKIQIPEPPPIIPIPPPPSKRIYITVAYDPESGKAEIVPDRPKAA